MNNVFEGKFCGLDFLSFLRGYSMDFIVISSPTTIKSWYLWTFLRNDQKEISVRRGFWIYSHYIQGGTILRNKYLCHADKIHHVSLFVLRNKIARSLKFYQ